MSVENRGEAWCEHRNKRSAMITFFSEVFVISGINLFFHNTAVASGGKALFEPDGIATTQPEIAEVKQCSSQMASYEVPLFVVCLPIRIGVESHTCLN